MGKTLFQRWFGSAAPSPVEETPVGETTEVMAQGGDAGAQFSLGLKFAVGPGAAQDYAQAEFWYLKAAAQDHPMAHVNLGLMYANGQGSPRDVAKSLVWFQKAAELNDAGAQFILGNTYHRAFMSSRPANDSQLQIDAFKWFQLAAGQGYKGADMACDMVNIAMSQEDVTEGQRLVAEFRAARNGSAGDPGSLPTVIY